MHRKYIIGILLFSLFFSCKNKTGEKEEITAPIKVKTALVKRHDLSEFLTFNGVTKYQQQEDIRANVTGYVSWMPFQRGDMIKRGQAFSSIRTKEQDALAEAAKIDSSLAKFSKPLSVISNASGIISNIKVVPNDYVSEGDVLATVSQPNTLAVQVSIPFEYAEKVKVGTDCKILLGGHPEIDAKISRVLNSTDSIGQAQHYLIRLPDADLPENLNVQVRIISEKAENALSVPKQALQTNELLTSFWVLKVVGDTLAIRENVKPLLESDSLVQIQSNQLKENDRVILSGGYQMQDSTSVSIEKE